MLFSVGIKGGSDNATLTTRKVGVLQDNVLWSFRTGGWIPSSAALGDVDGDGDLDVVITSEDNRTYALDGATGFLLWFFDAGRRFDSYYDLPTIALGDLGNDGNMDVVVGSDDGEVYALRGKDGIVLWNYTYQGWFFPVIADVNGDNMTEVLFSNGADLVCLNGSDGSLIWKVRPSEHWILGPALGDLDADGVPEIVVGSHYNKVFVIDGSDGQTKRLYNFEDPSYYASSINVQTPALGDVDLDGVVDIVVTTDDSNIDNIYVLSGKNETVLWSYSTGAWPPSLPALGDVSGDGRLDVVVVSMEGHVYAIDALTGELIWFNRFSNWRGIDAKSPALGDFDSDGDLDVLTVCYDGHLAVLDGRTGYLRQYLLFDSSFQGTVPVVIGSLQHDRSLDFVVVEQYKNLTYAVNIPNAGSRLYWSGEYGNPDDSGTRCLTDIDPDMDMLSTYSEALLGTDPENPDTDSDGMPDGWEVTHRLNPIINDADHDPDLDGIPNLAEYQRRSDPNNPLDSPYWSQTMFTLLAIPVITIPLVAIIIYHRYKKKDTSSSANLSDPAPLA